jgi:hypothetical protein
MPDAVPLHCFKQCYRIGHIVAVIQQRFFNGLAHQGEGGKMHDGLDGMLAEYGVQVCRVPKVATE